jgi:hypothetical protein
MTVVDDTISGPLARTAAVDDKVLEEVEICSKVSNCEVVNGVK